jgi:hypothetical protein
MGLFGAQSAESILLQLSTVHQLKIQTLERQIAQPTRTVNSHTHTQPLDLTRPKSWAQLMPFGLGTDSKAQLRQELADLKADKTLEHLHAVSLISVTLLPKTEVATDLLRKELLRDESKVVDDQSDSSAPDFQENMRMGRMSPDQRDYLNHEVLKAQDSRSVGWSLGTSFVSEFLIVGLAAWLFCRRDF